METGSQVCSQDLIKDFCEAYISEHREIWPTSECDLANAFVKFFGVRALVHVSRLERFFVQTNIELKEGNLPAGLLGVNMSYGSKRRIDLCQRREQIYFQIYTVLHEIREIIENDFSRFGFHTTHTRDLEASADEFAFWTVLCSMRDPLKDMVKTASEIESKWQRWTTLGLIYAGVAAFGFYSFMGAFFPHVTVIRGSGVRFER